MAKNITLMGASYSDVPAVNLPQTGGGTARFDDVSVTTATASDVAQGKVFVASDGTITTGTASGGGGASNFVTGTFTGTTTGVAMDVTLSYSGDGYPIAVAIYPTSGYQTGTDIYNLLQRYVITHYSGVKRTNGTPTYTSSGENNMFCNSRTYKSSTSTASTVNISGTANANVLSNSSASSTASLVVRFKNKTTMSVYIASTSYGFAAGIEYTYHVIYSE